MSEASLRAGESQLSVEKGADRDSMDDNSLIQLFGEWRAQSVIVIVDMSRDSGHEWLMRGNDVNSIQVRSQ
jgi:hypothetical protein